MGWKEFFEINVKFYTNLIQVFYTNLTIDHNDVIHSRFGGLYVSLSLDDLANRLCLPNEVFDIFHEHLNSFQSYPEG